MLERLRKGDAAPPQGLLGVSTVTLTPDVKERLGLSADTGAVIDEITAGSPAAAAGLQPLRRRHQDR